MEWERSKENNYQQEVISRMGTYFCLILRLTLAFLVHARFSCCLFVFSLSFRRLTDSFLSSVCSMHELRAFCYMATKFWDGLSLFSVKEIDWMPNNVLFLWIWYEACKSAVSVVVEVIYMPRFASDILFEVFFESLYSKIWYFTAVNKASIYPLREQFCGRHYCTWHVSYLDYQ